MSAPHEDAQAATEVTPGTAPAGAGGGRDDLSALCARLANPIRARLRGRSDLYPRLAEDLAHAVLPVVLAAIAEAEAARDHLKIAAQAETRAATRWMAEANRAETTIARVRALVQANSERTECGAGWLLDPAAVLAALDQPERALAAQAERDQIAREWAEYRAANTILQQLTTLRTGERDRLKAALAEVLAVFSTAKSTETGQVLGHLVPVGAIHPDDFARWRAALDQPKETT
jgi:hypothetical protein